MSRPGLRLLPESAAPGAGILLVTRGLRGFGDGLISLVLPAYLTALGFSPLQIGLIATATLLGASCLTLAMGVVARRWPDRTLLLWSSGLMVLSPLAFVSLDALGPLLVVAFFGTLNPSSGDISLFLPLEHARLAHDVGPRDRTTMFTLYTIIGAVSAAFGALAAVLPSMLTDLTGVDTLAALRIPFIVYAAIGVAVLILYRLLPRHSEERPQVRNEPLRQSRSVVLGLTALFALDAFGGGFVVQSLVALWLFARFGIDLATAGTIFFWTGILASVSLLAAPWLSRRIGLVNTMVFTHLPASVAYIIIPFVPKAEWVVALLLARSLFAQMDVPTRTSYVMAVVSPGERAAAASITAVPRSLASAASPVIAGALLTASSFAWPLLICGIVKAVYDILLLRQFRSIQPPEERDPLG